MVGGNALFLTGHLSNEPEKTSGVLCALTRKDVRCPMCADSVCAGRGWLEQTKLQLTLFCRVWDLRFDLLHLLAQTRDLWENYFVIFSTPIKFSNVSFLLFSRTSETCFSNRILTNLRDGPLYIFR